MKRFFIRQFTIFLNRMGFYHKTQIIINTSQLSNLLKQFIQPNKKARKNRVDGVDRLANEIADEWPIMLLLREF